MALILDLVFGTRRDFKSGFRLIFVHIFENFDHFSWLEVKMQKKLDFSLKQTRIACTKIQKS